MSYDSSSSPHIDLMMVKNGTTLTFIARDYCDTYPCWSLDLLPIPEDQILTNVGTSTETCNTSFTLTVSSPFQTVQCVKGHNSCCTQTICTMNKTANLFIIVIEDELPETSTTIRKLTL